MKNNFFSSIWEFDQTNDENKELHNFFRWYGKLVPQIPRNLINIYSEKGDIVLANFLGSGTIALESILSERKIIGYDSNPLAILLSTVKTTAINFDYKKFIAFYDKEIMSIKNLRNIFDNEYEEKWFSENVLTQIKIIKQIIDNYSCSKQDNNLLNLVFLSTIQKSSKVDSRCINHIVLDKNKKEIDVYLLFKNNLFKLVEELKKFKKELTKAEKKIKIGDARNLVEDSDESVDLIISHPPYLGNVNYSNITQLANYFSGYVYKEVKADDISTDNLDKYLTDMQKVFEEMYRVLKKDKYACVIIGDNRKNGKIIPTFSYFIQNAQKIGFSLEDIFIWILNNKAGMSIKRHGNHIDHNYILVFKK